MEPEQTARHPLVDCACYGEGECTVRSLGEMLAGGDDSYERVPGVVFKQGREVVRTPAEYVQNLDDLEFHPYELLDLGLYARTSATHFYYQTSRGCTHRCRFCNYNYQYRWRGKSSVKVASEIRTIQERFKPYEFYFSDGNFFADKRRVSAILQEIRNSCLPNLRWTSFCRFDDLCSLSDETLALMRQTGCFKLNLGGESGSDSILRYLNKGITSADIVRGVERANSHGILTDVSFIAGTPRETPEDLYKTVDMVLRIYEMHVDNMVNGLYYYQPYPNTPLTQEIVSRYRLPLPATLDEWGRRPITSPYREYLPWLSDEAYRRIFSLTQIVNFLYLRKRLEIALRNKLIAKPYRLLYKISDILLPLVHLRLKKRNFVFPLEWRLYYILKKKLLHIDL
jgi:radical SAM superfamily enzyme YgiQ (UPF0313 family)